MEHLLLCVALLTGIALVSLDLSSMQFPIVGFRRSRLVLGKLCDRLSQWKSGSKDLTYHTQASFLHSVRNYRNAYFTFLWGQRKNGLRTRKHFSYAHLAESIREVCQTVENPKK